MKINHLYNREGLRRSYFCLFVGIISVKTTTLVRQFTEKPANSTTSSLGSNGSKCLCVSDVYVVGNELEGIFDIFVTFAYTNVHKANLITLITFASS